jgi:hypothetical protein
MLLHRQHMLIYNMWVNVKRWCRYWYVHTYYYCYLHACIICVIICWTLNDTNRDVTFITRQSAGVLLHMLLLMFWYYKYNLRATKHVDDIMPAKYRSARSVAWWYYCKHGVHTTRRIDQETLTYSQNSNRKP